MKINVIKPVSISIMEKLIQHIYFFQRNNQDPSVNDLVTTLNLSMKSIKNGLIMLRQIKILKIEEEISLNDEIFSKVDENYIILHILFEKIMLLPIFNEYIFLLAKKITKLNAGVILKKIFNFQISPNTIISTFNGWLNSFKINVNENEIKTNFDRSYLISNIAPILLIRDIFNRNLGDIPELVLVDLCKGLSNAKLDSKAALTDTGRALENFLRITYDGKIDMSKSNGIGQIANCLRNKKLINSKICNILISLGSIRSIGNSHGIDKENKKVWEVSEESAKIYNFLTIKTIKSLLNYINGLLTF